MKRRAATIRIIILLIAVSIISYSSAKLTVTQFGFIDSDISYASSTKNSLDLYIPHIKNYPIVLFIHGGSFVAGDRKDFPYAQIGEAFQQSGVGCAVMSYRLSQDSVWPAQPRDVAKAIQWLKNNIQEYGGDSHRIIIVGHSAGGHLAALVSSDSTYLSEIGLSLNDIAGTVVMGSMMSDGGGSQYLTFYQEQQLFQSDWFYKIFGSKKNFLNSLPIHHVNASMPKMLIILADAELFDPPKQRTILEFIEASKPHHLNIDYQIIANRTHMETVEKMVNPSDAVLQTILKFIKKL